MEIFSQLKEILTRQLALKPELIKLESKLIEDLGADSLDAVEIITAIEEQFEITLSDEEASMVKTVNDLINLVNLKLQLKPEQP